MNAPERRGNPELRAIFERAYDVIRPFFDASNSWTPGHGHESLAYRALRESFPELSPQQMAVIVTAAQRVFHSGSHVATP